MVRLLKKDTHPIAPAPPFREIRKFGQNPFAEVEGLLDRHGHTIRLPFGPGFVPTWISREPEHVEEVLVAKRESFQKGLGLQWLKSIFGNSILVSEGDHWRKNRRLMAPAFTRKALQSYADTMVECIDTSLEDVSSGTTLVMNQWTMEVTLVTVLKCLFGTEIGSRVKDVEHALDDGLLYADHVLSRFTPPIDWIPTKPKRSLARARSVVYGIVDEFIAARMKSGEMGTDLLGLLLSTRDEEGRSLPHEEIREEVITLLLAGHETTALNLTYLFMILGRRPDVVDVLQQELDEVLGDAPPTMADLARLPLLEQAMKESLRMYPPAPIISRQAVQDTTMGEWHIPAGNQVMVPIWAIHHDPRWYEDPYTFKLERWTAEEEAKRHRFSFMPFGGGNRVCIGDQFAKMEVRLMAARILQRFRPLTLNTSDPELKLTITLRAMDPVMVTFHAR